MIQWDLTVFYTALLVVNLIQCMFNAHYLTTLWCMSSHYQRYSQTKSIMDLAMGPVGVLMDSQTWFKGEKQEIMGHGKNLMGCIERRFGLQLLYKLDKSTACRHLKSPRSVSSRSLHLILVTKRSQSWSWMTPFCSMSIGPPIPEIWLFQNLTLKIQVEGDGQDQAQCLHFMPRIHLICLLFIAWQSESRSRSWPRSNLMVTFKA